MREIDLSETALSEYRRIAPTLGYSANNAVDALAFYLLSLWGVANDYRGNVGPAQSAAVRRQAAPVCPAIDDQLQTGALQQEFSEMLAVQGMIMAGAHEVAVRANDEHALKRYADLARSGGHMLFGADPIRIRLTDHGFRRAD